MVNSLITDLFYSILFLTIRFCNSRVKGWNSIKVCLSHSVLWISKWKKATIDCNQYVKIWDKILLTLGRSKDEQYNVLISIMIPLKFL